MKRAEVIEKLKSVEPDLRAHGVAALYLFGSHSRDDAGPGSDLDVFVDPAGEDFYGLDNYVGAYEKIRDAFPGTAIGYSTRTGLSKYIRSDVEAEAVRVF
jgi:predicted nucleotidyltransferase